MVRRRRARLGLALGSGSARGWAHLGVLHALEGMGVRPEIVCGTSVGAMVGAAFAAGRLETFQEWITGLSRWDMLRLMDWTGYGVQGERLMTAFGARVPDCEIRRLALRFGCVATDVASGREVWFTEGSVHAAVRASIALPGLFRPVVHDSRWLVDGGLVDPVPVSLCRALGADRVIAINLNGDLIGRATQLRQAPARTAEMWDWLGQRVALVLGTAGDGPRDTAAATDDTGTGPPPALMELMMTSMHIMQDRITRSRLAGDPPELELAPRVGQIALFDFHRVAEGIEAGRECVERHRSLIAELLDRHNVTPPPEAAP